MLVLVFYILARNEMYQLEISVFLSGTFLIGSLATDSEKVEVGIGLYQVSLWREETLHGCVSMMVRGIQAR